MSGSPVTRGPYQNGLRTRREIIASAARIFATYGYAGGSLRQIAGDVGVTPAALARHFDNKEGLLAAVLESWDRETDARIPPDARGISYFYRVLGTIAHNREDRGLVELLLTLSAEASNVDHPARPFIQDRYERVIARGVECLTEARDAGEVLRLDDAAITAEVRLLYATMDGIQLQWLLNPSIDTLAIFRRSLTATVSRWAGYPVHIPPDALPAAAPVNS
ncbi:MAG: hypothetical protein QOI02_892 [Actinomycetota bacterium]|nr:hypothetical protein [Actinomycetota bacterium]